MLDLTLNEDVLKRSIDRAKDRKIVIPTFSQLRDPELIPENIKSRLSVLGLWEVDPLNLFRVTWKNEPKEFGGLFGSVNYLEFPSELTGVDARIIALTGKWFPTGAHKVGATFGCIVPRLVTGQFDPANEKAVWPSTGNFCRGGAYIASLLGSDSIAVLPEEMSEERFDWLKKIAGEVITTSGGESNIKEIYDKCDELRKTRNNVHIFNQFEEFGNYLWHYIVTGGAVEELLHQVMEPGDSFAGIVLMSGSAGTLASGDYLKEKFPYSKIAVGEPVQCPTLLLNGYGEHRIEGIGDKHVPWIHNVRNTDLVIGVDDDVSVNLLRLFNESAGREYLVSVGVAKEAVDQLGLAGMSGIANLVAAIKFCRYYELSEKHVVVTVLTDSLEMYRSRLKEYEKESGAYSTHQAIADFNRYLMSVTTDNMQELTHYDRKRIHNLKYFTWVEQQGKKTDELDAQWYDYPAYWKSIQDKTEGIDNLINEFNQMTGLLKSS